MLSVWAIVLDIIVLMAIVLVVVDVRRRRPAASGLPPRLSTGEDGEVRVVLEVEVSDPDSPAVRRLVHETAAGVFARLPDAEVVEIRSSKGDLLGRVSRRAHPHKTVRFPRSLPERHLPASRAPNVALHLHEGALPPVRTRLAPPEGPWPHRPLIDMFELPPAVRSAVRDPDDPVDLVRAILDAAGVAHRVDRDVVLAGELAIVVLPATAGVVGHDALNHAYLRVVGTGARRGLIVAMGYVDPREIRRREMAAPQVLHAGPEAIQRMADAVAVRADPLRFAAAIPMTADAAGA